LADIFISYATEDRAHAGTLAGVLATRGWTIWWDREIDAGADFEQVIEARNQRRQSVSGPLVSAIGQVSIG
jgi:hypothetical protein